MYIIILNSETFTRKIVEREGKEEKGKAKEFGALLFFLTI